MDFRNRHLTPLDIELDFARQPSQTSFTVLDGYGGSTTYIRNDLATEAQRRPERIVRKAQRIVEREKRATKRRLRIRRWLDQHTR